MALKLLGPVRNEGSVAYYVVVGGVESVGFPKGFVYSKILNFTSPQDCTFVLLVKVDEESVLDTEHVKEFPFSFSDLICLDCDLENSDYLSELKTDIAENLRCRGLRFSLNDLQVFLLRSSENSQELKDTFPMEEVTRRKSNESISTVFSEPIETESESPVFDFQRSQSFSRASVTSKLSISPQQLMRKKQELDLTAATQTLQHAALLKLLNKRLKQIKSISLKKKLSKACDEMGAKLIKTSDILIANQKPIGYGRTAKVYEGLLKVSSKDADFLNLDPILEAFDEEIVTISADGKGKIYHQVDEYLSRGSRSGFKPRRRLSRKFASIDDSLILCPGEVATKVAIKRFTCRFVTDKVASSFQQELEALCRLNNEGIVRCLGVYIDDEDEQNKLRFQEGSVQLLIVYELCSNGDLRSLLAHDEWNEVDWKTRARIAFPAACALKEMHELGIIHRDLKPDNLLVNEDFVLKLGDFGVAKMASEVDRSDCEGTLGYSAPEIVHGSSSGSFEADVFSFGVILYELFYLQDKDVTSDCGSVASDTRSNPFLRSLDTYISQFDLDCHLESLEFCPEMPEGLSNMIRSCLRANPEDRCSVEEVVSVLKTFVC